MTYPQPFHEPTIEASPADEPLPPGAAVAARASFMPPTDQLSEQDYRTGSPGVPDRYIDNQQAHPDFYGDEESPEAYPG